MTRAILRALLLFPLAIGLRADSALDVHELFERLAGALSDRKIDVVDASFDRSIAGYDRLRADVEALWRASGTESRIEWISNEGDDRNRSVQLNWQLEISERGGASAVTRRTEKVSCHLKKSANGWQIVSFLPVHFFAPPDVDAAWRTFLEAALGLTESAAAGSNDAAEIPAANARKFMEAFDPAMPGFAVLRENVLAIEQAADVESGVDLVKNEGDDRSRTIEVDWSLTLVSHESKVATTQRRETVTCKLERQGRRWRIVSLEPRSLFAAPR